MTRVETIAALWGATTHWFFFALGILSSLRWLLFLSRGFGWLLSTSILGAMSASGYRHQSGNGGDTTPAGHSVRATISGITYLLHGFGINHESITPDPFPENFPIASLSPAAACEFYFSYDSGGGGGVRVRPVLRA